MSIFHQAQYIHTAANWEQLPAADVPEIAFAGRSNAGKSSAINTLANKTRLAFTSKTPGRTQQIQFFSLPGGVRFADLPGYGYAKVPIAVRQHWQEFLARYLAERDNIIGLMLIMDARHPLTDLDRQLLNWFLPTGKPVHCLLTKADKLSKNESMQTLTAVRKSLKDLGWTDSRISAQVFSSSKKQGMHESEVVVSRWLGLPEPKKVAL